MENKLSSVSMNGRMAYIIMCVEAYLKNKYPNRNWTFVAEKMWQATSKNWGEWPDAYSIIIPDVLLQYEDYDENDMSDSISRQEYAALIQLYDGITNGSEDDPSDELNYILNKPFEMAMVYEGTIIGDGSDSFDIIEQTESILRKNNIPLPDYKNVLFSSASELNGWGNDFDGRKLSIILN